MVNRLGYDKALSSLEQNALTPQDAYQMGLKADHPQAELLVVSCTDYRALEAVPALEQVLGKPVITSNSALMYACLKRLDMICTVSRRVVICSPAGTSRGTRGLGTIRI